MTNKSNNKHEYELRVLQQVGWFTHEKACKICGHVNNGLRLDSESNIQNGE